MLCTQPKWEVREGVLGLCKPDGTFWVPRSAQIFVAAFSAGAEFDIKDVRTTLPTLRFSRLGARIEVHLVRREDGRIACSALIRKGGCCHSVTENLRHGIDHVVLNDTWYHLSENFDEVVDYLRQSGIEDLDCLSYSSFLKALRNAQNFAGVKVVNEVVTGAQLAASNSEMACPPGLKAQLYPYQESGFSWLKFITNESCGCILGDEMGLGKTLQVIALLLFRKSKGCGPSLVVAPVSLLENWRREISKFAPTLTVLVHHGASRTGYYKTFLSYDVVVAAYSSVVNDSSLLCSMSWDLLIADEAQNIKSPYAQRTKGIKRIPRRATIAVSGTPFENHMSDIWSVVDFVIPGFFGSLTEFDREYPDTIEGADKVEPLLTPLMIRRRVADVAKDLPEKVEIPVALVMTPSEIALYEDTRNRISGGQTSTARMFAELSGLRMHCTHPSLSKKGNSDDPVRCCTKYGRLCEILAEVKILGEKAILFTSFTGMCDLLAKDIPSRLGIPVSVIDGRTPANERQPLVDAFSVTNGCALLVLNPRAAATGLNITAANHVIHYNLEWNPSLEDQASARAYRRGQTKTVFVHRMYYVNTVEEFVNDKIRAKRDMTTAAVVGNVGDAVSREDYLEALTYTPKGRVEGIAYE